MQRKTCVFRKSLRIFALASIIIFSVFDAPGNSSSGASLKTLSPGQGALNGFTLTGDPASATGATWTYKDTVDGVSYDLAGVLFRPTTGSGPFPAVIVSHGYGGNARGYSSGIAREMRDWGLVGLATNYTHAGGGVAIGSPGTVNEPGASQANLLRAHKCWDILASLGDVDMRRVAAHGHSMGAFITAALVGTYPNDFRVASHTAGGVNQQNTAWTKPAQANGIVTPYQMHHGDSDTVVPLADDQALDALLQAKGAVHQLNIYAGFSHSAISQDRTMFQRVRDWYTAHGLFSSSIGAATTVSAANYRGSPLAVESIVTAFGSKLATTTLAAAILPLPTLLGGTSVKVRDSAGVERRAPLFFVSPTQINYLIPAGTANGAATMTITGGDGAVSTGNAQIATIAPGLFSADASGQGLAAAVIFRVKADGSQSFEPVAQFDQAQNRFVAIPIDLGPGTDQVFLILFGAGIRFRSALSAVSAMIGGVDGQVLFAGAQDGFAGLDQVNVRLSRSLIGRGEVDVTLTADGQATNIVKVSTK